MENNTEYNSTVTPLWPTNSGNLKRAITSQDAIDEIRAAVDQLEVGGQLLVKFLPEEKRKDAERSPKAYLEYISKEKMDAFKASRDEGGI